jgi:serine protease
MKRYRKTLGLMALALTCLVVSTVHATPTDRIIIKVSESMRPAVLADGAPAPRARERVSSLSAAAGHEVVYLRAMSGGADVVRLPRAMPLEQVQAMAEAMAQLPGVEYAEPDERVFPMLAPDDNLLGQQWHLLPLNTTPANRRYSIDAQAAWDLTVGDAVVVAVVDTGIHFSHEDLLGKLLPGYDFVTEDASGIFFTANDGSARDSDATDPGDWITDREALAEGCLASDSSWHGTHVAGIVAAATDNSRGVAGISWGAMVLPVRGLGKCGGYLSDIADGIRWAAGVGDLALPSNPYPARIINLSLGGGQCTSTWQSAINAANTAGALIVAAAGNSGATESPGPVAPGSCAGVLTVAASNQDGSRPSFSSYGSAVDIAAPGTFILSTSDSGTRYAESDDYDLKSGTSMATPMVSGVAALLLARNPDLSRAELFDALVGNVTPFPADFVCPETDACGAGILNANLALLSVADAGQRPAAFSFGTVMQVEKLSSVESNAVTVLAAAPLEVRVLAGEYSIGCTQTFTAEQGMVSNGQEICLRHLASDLPGHPAATILKVGHYSASFVSMTGPATVVPDEFSFMPRTDVTPGVLVTSDPVSITGIDAPAPVSVVGGSYSQGCVAAAYTSEPGYLAPGSTVCVRHTSSSEPGTDTNTTLIVGGDIGLARVFTSTTAGSRPSSGGGGGLALWLIAILLIYAGSGVVRTRKYTPQATPATAP